MASKKITLGSLSVKVEDVVKSVEDLTITVEDVAKSVEDLSVKVEDVVKSVEDLTITVEDLARITKKGFDYIEGKVDSLEKKMDDGFNSINAQLKQTRDDISDLPNIRDGLYDHEQRLERLERKPSVAK